MSDHFDLSSEFTVRVPKKLIKQVRRFVQDYPEVNELFEGEETTDQQIARYLVDVVEQWNSTPPLITSAELNLNALVMNPALRGVRKNIVDAAAARIMSSIVLKLARNDMPYTAGNVTIQPHAVWRNLQPIVQDMKIEFKQFLQEYKIALNIQGAWGSVHTEMYVGHYLDRDGYITLEF